MVVELRHIRYFLAVAEERHFTRAAAKVGIGQPPLSQQIKDLEREVGAALFHRLAHGAELTEAGKAFLAGVKEMPLIAERASMAARRDRCASASPRRQRSTSACRRRSAPFAALIPKSTSRSRRPTRHGSSSAYGRERSMSCSCGQVRPVPKSCSSAGSRMSRWGLPFLRVTLLPLSKRSISRC